MTSNTLLDGQTVLVTGASRGIGAATARVLAANGARVIIHYGRDRTAAEAVLSDIGGRGVVIQADLSERDGAAKLWEAAEAAVGQIHALVNNAGIRLTARIEDDLSVWQQAWRDDLQVNLMAQMYIDKYGKDDAVGDIPLGEMVEPREVAELITFVLQPDQRSLNGATLDINGGSYVR